MSRQIGSFLGAYGGRVIYDALGLAGSIIHVAFALIRPSQPPAPVLKVA
jgi:hypothetical protein